MVNLLNLGKAFFLSAAMLLSGCNSVVPEPIQVVQEIKSLETLVAEKFRNHDPWVLEIVKHKAAPNNPVSLVKAISKDIGPQKDYGGLYDTGSKEIFFYDRPETVDSANHELWHVFEDMVDKEIIKCKAPSKSEIKQYCDKQRQLPVFYQFEQRVDAWSEAKKIMFDIVAENLRQKQAYNFGLMMSGVKGIAAIDEKENKRVFEENERISKIYSSIAKIKCSFSDALEGIEQSADKLKAAHKLYKSETDKFRESVVTWAKKDCEKFDESYDEKVADYDKEINDLEKKRTDANAKQTDVKINTLKEKVTSIKFEKAQRTYLWQDLKLRNGALALQRMEHMLSVPSLKKIIIDQEMMARTYKGLAEIYLGNPTLNLLPITEEGLDLLEKYRQNGPLLRKMIEKGRVALQMKEDGIPKDEIKQKLEYATSIEYRGKTYNWPLLDIELDKFPEKKQQRFIIF